MITLRSITTALIIAVPFASAGLALGGRHDFLLKPPASGSRLADLDLREQGADPVVSGATSTSAIQSELDAGSIPFAAAQDPGPVLRARPAHSSVTRNPGMAPVRGTAVKAAHGKPVFSIAARSSNEPLSRTVQATPSRWLDLDP